MYFRYRYSFVKVFLYFVIEFWLRNGREYNILIIIMHIFKLIRIETTYQMGKTTSLFKISEHKKIHAENTTSREIQQWNTWQRWKIENWLRVEEVGVKLTRVANGKEWDTCLEWIWDVWKNLDNNASSKRGKNTKGYCNTTNMTKVDANSAREQNCPIMIKHERPNGEVRTNIKVN